MTFPLERQRDENLKQYKLRLCRNKDIYGLSWQDVANLINKETGENWSESKYRKWFSAYQEGYEDGIKENINNQDILEELEEKQRFLQKEKYKYLDQKREYSNLLRLQARFEHLKEELLNAIKELEKVKPLQFNSNPIFYQQHRKAIALFSDWHYGMDFKNSLNTYNPTVFRQRIEKLVHKIIQYGKRHEIEELTIAELGDMIAGLIHIGTRVQSSEDVVRQIMVVSEVLSEVIAKLASEFRSIRFISVIGNHARLVPDKNAAILKENFEYLIPWYVELRLSQLKNVTVLWDNDGYFVDDVGGEKFVYVHGDLDQVNNAVKNIPQMLGIVPKYIFSGHIHHNTVKECGRTTVITNGSLMGVDDYAISKRFFAEPMQKLMILDGSDIECTYDIKLN